MTAKDRCVDDIQGQGNSQQRARIAAMCFLCKFLCSKATHTSHRASLACMGSLMGGLYIRLTGSLEVLNGEVWSYWNYLSQVSSLLDSSITSDHVSWAARSTFGPIDISVIWTERAHDSRYPNLLWRERKAERECVNLPCIKAVLERFYPIWNTG